MKLLKFEKILKNEYEDVSIKCNEHYLSISYYLLLFLTFNFIGQKKMYFELNFYFFLKIIKWILIQMKNQIKQYFKY